MNHDLFTYPQAAGFKGTETSQAAAETIDCHTLRAKVVEVLERAGPLTADQCAARMGLSILSVRPRFSELRNLGKVQDTGERRENSSGRRAVVWALAA